MTRSRAVIVAGALWAGLLSGCGGASGLPTPLPDDTAAVVRAVNAHDVAAARRALALLDADATAARRAGRISDSTLASLRAAAARVLTDVDAGAGPAAGATPAPGPTAAAPSTAAASAAPTATGGGKDGKDGRGGKGKKH